jgi:hypothetical protein
MSLATSTTAASKPLNLKIEAVPTSEMPVGGRPLDLPNVYYPPAQRRPLNLVEFINHSARHKAIWHSPLIVMFLFSRT